MIDVHQEAIMKVSILADDVKTFMTDKMIETIVEMTTKNLRATLEGIKDYDFLNKLSDEPFVLTSGGLLELNIVRKPKQENTRKPKQNTDDSSFNGRVSYIMDRILEILITKSRKMLNIDPVVIYCHYTDKSKKPAELLDFKGVDVSCFSEFELRDAGAWKIVKIKNNGERADYFIMDIKNGRGYAFITIDKYGCALSITDKQMLEDPLIVSALPEISELCKTFNNDKSK